MPDIEQYYGKAIELVMTFGPKLVLALFTLIFGLIIIGWLTRLSLRIMERTKVNATLRPFLASLISWLAKALLLISVASMVGIETTSFVAVIGAAGLAVGLALQGSLSNFAGGTLIMIFRPYEVGDLIEAQGQLGVVKEIQIFTTILQSLENKRIIVPNGPLANGNIINYTAEGKLRVDTVIGISYGANIDQAKAALMEMMTSNPLVLNDPAPSVNVLELGDSSVNLAVRPYCRPEHYWDVYFHCYEQGKKTLDAVGIEIPFPQRDVHIHNAS
ncbi:MAG: mechanosensitive ion channel domain-containing protein [Myxococcota bacterium]